MRAKSRDMSMELGVCHDRQQIHAKHTKVCRRLYLGSNCAPLLHPRWSSHAHGLIVAKDAFYGNAEKKWEAGE